MTGKLKNILLIASLLVLIAGGYYVATHVDLFMGHHTRASQIDIQTTELEKEIIIPLERLTAVKIDETFFTTPEFKALVDKSINLRPPVLKRSNPFDPAE